MDKEPANRWPTACAMVEALDDALGEDAEPATAPTAPSPARSVERRRPWGPVLVAALIAGLLAGGVIAAVIGGGGGSSEKGGTTRAKRPSTAQRTAAAAPAAQTQAPAQSQPAQAATQASSPAALQAQGHALIGQGDYGQAIATLGKATQNCPVTQTDPCAYALFDLGHALRLAGRPQDAIPVLQQRLQNPNQRGIVQAELERAQQDAGQSPGKAGKPGKGPKKDKKKGD
jgi:serine/threonine-protein kinase